MGAGGFTNNSMGEGLRGEMGVELFEMGFNASPKLKPHKFGAEPREFDPDSLNF